LFRLSARFIQSRQFPAGGQVLHVHFPLALKSRFLTSIGVLFLVLFSVQVSARDTSAPQMADMPGMDHGSMHMSPAPEDPAIVAERLKGKLQSEFNHHLAGMFLIIAGAFILGEDRLSKLWPGLRYVWPACFLAGGIFLLFLSDMDVWPFGPLTPWYAVTHDVEDLQHKIFGLILLVLGIIEWQRTRGRLKASWSAWLFPIVGMSGAILLLFHVHSGDMSAPHAMETMDHIKREHLGFTMTGFGVSLSKGLAETRSRWQQLFISLWPALLLALGLLLMFYTE
jgi:hypothetical protein